MTHWHRKVGGGVLQCQDIKKVQFARNFVAIFLSTLRSSDKKNAPQIFWLLLHSIRHTRKLRSFENFAKFYARLAELLSFEKHNTQNLSSR